ncbi:hypothetical protein, partial [Enterobacter hormaechei]|uniref:hypothetical protein n=1 Tax=Enterobacter hormaechei TaxID=158836 RepID=UPI001D0190ED
MHLIAICTVSDIVSPPPLNASTNAEPQTRNITAEIYHDTTKGFFIIKMEKQTNIMNDLYICETTPVSYVFNT